MVLSDSYSEINLRKLIYHANQWEWQYSCLKSITLYQFPIDAPHGKRYALVFELPEIE